MCVICSNLRPAAVICDYAQLPAATPPRRTALFEGVDAPSGLVTTTDPDYVRIALMAGQSYTLRLGGEAGRTLPSDGFLWLRDPISPEISRNDDSGGSANARITSTPATSGTYYLEADFNIGATTNGSYRLSASPSLPTASGVSDQLTSGHWDWVASQYPGTLSGPRSFDIGPWGTLTAALSGLTANGQTLARAALQAWTLRPTAVTGCPRHPACPRLRVCPIS